MITNNFIALDIAYSIQSAPLFEIFEAYPYSIFLDSCSDLRNELGIDVIAASPYLRFVANENQYHIYDENDLLVESGEKALVKLLQLEKDENGSLLGYFGYHCNDESFHLEKKYSCTSEEMPDICLGFYAWYIEVNHKNKTALFKYNTEKFRDTDLQAILDKIKTSQAQFSVQSKTSNLTQDFANSNFTKDEYLESFNKVRAYIENGDCYQVNLAQRFTLNFDNQPWQHYKFLRNLSPAPYSCYFSNPFGKVLSFSPESFIKIDHSGNIISQPIKGTRKRHIDMSLDQSAAQSLANSAKDRAENLMIVDLIRNDLSKSAKLNSVKVDKLFEIQSFANVHHMVSQISAKKAVEKSNLSVFLDCFPGGSITGAPKKRAMEIIQELEPNNRQVYCGAIGRIDFEGEMEFNIAIRSIVIKDGVLYCWGGGGLVADSQGESEYQESITKISNLVPIQEAPNEG